MRVRINAIVPLFKIPDPLVPGKIDRILAFSVYFPQCRKLLAQYSAYNPNNDAQPISYDDLFIQRRFASTIISESNTMENRLITDFLTGEDVLLEAERIKYELFKKEHDFWEY